MPGDTDFQHYYRPNGQCLYCGEHRDMMRSIKCAAIEGWRQETYGRESNAFAQVQRDHFYVVPPNGSERP